jgi:hypothetical protein
MMNAAQPDAHYDGHVTAAKAAETSAKNWTKLQNDHAKFVNT